MSEKPAIFGGEPLFKEILPITQPTLPDLNLLIPKLSQSFSSKQITNNKFVKEFEQESAKILNVSNAIAMNSCTSGLILTQKILGLKGDIIVPSFTFSATGHSVHWNNLKMVFADIDKETYNIDPNKVESLITNKTSAILATHIFGNPCDVEKLEKIAEKNNLKLIFDAAHGFGSKVGNKNIGQFGDAEVFSLSPTKLVVAGEGGLVATKHESLKNSLNHGRNYGDDGSYDCKFNGLNARMEEFNALLALETLKMLDENVKKRNELVKLYKFELSKVPGISFQKIKDGNTSTFKDFSIFVNKEDFLMDRNDLQNYLSKENIMTKKYFYPVLHKQTAYAHLHDEFNDSLENTNYISENVLSLPLFSHMSEEQVNNVCYAIKRIYEYKNGI